MNVKQFTLSWVNLTPNRSLQRAVKQSIACTHVMDKTCLEPVTDATRCMRRMRAIEIASAICVLYENKLVLHNTCC